MGKEIAKIETANAIELALIGGDLSKLTADERLGYYKQTCESLGLNPLTKPFDYIQLNGKLTLYARKDATEQLRRIYGVSIVDMQEKEVAGVYIVTVKAQDREGRTDMAKGAVTISNLKGDALANATMKAETKAKRRVTLSICGLGMLDETEIETIKDAVVAPLNLKTADELQNEATKKALGDDNISWDSNGQTNMATRQVVKKSAQIFTYDLQSFLNGCTTEDYNRTMRFLENKKALEVSPGVYQINEYIERMAKFLKADDAVEQQTEAA